MSLNCIIIGSGNIGALYDNPQSQEILTHANAYKRHENFNLIGFVDSDIEKSKDAAKIWGGDYFDNIDEAFAKNSIDVVSVTTSDSSHYKIIKEILLNFSVKLIFAEKPLAKTLDQAQELLILSEEKNIPILVNYSRRFVPEIIEVKGDIESGVYGDFLSGSGYYGKGILHNGSHMIDLLRYTIGEIEDFKYIDKVNDFYEDDPSVSVLLSFCGNKSFMLNAINCNKFTIFEMDLIFDRARVRVVNSGFQIKCYKVSQDKVFKDYKTLALYKKVDTSLDQALLYATDNIYEYLTESKDLKCTIEDGISAMEIPLQIINSISRK